MSDHKNLLLPFGCEPVGEDESKYEVVRNMNQKNCWKSFRLTYNNGDILNSFELICKNAKNIPCIYAVSTGKFNLLKYLILNKYNVDKHIISWTLNSGCSDLAIEISDYLLKLGYIPTYTALIYAIKYEKYDYMKVLFSKMSTRTDTNARHDPTCVKYYMNNFILAAAAGKGNLDICKWLVDNGVVVDSSVNNAAAEHGHVHILKWIHVDKEASLERGEDVDPFEGIITIAAANNRINVLEWAYRFGFSCWYHDSPLNAAIKNGHIDTVTYMYDRGAITKNDFLCPFTLDTIAKYGRFGILDWVIKIVGRESIMQYYVLDRMAISAIYGMQPYMLKWALDNTTKDVLEKAPPSVTYTGRDPFRRVDTIREDRLRGERVIHTTIFISNFYMFKIGIDYGCPVYKDTLEDAVRGDNLEIIKYLCTHYNFNDHKNYSYYNIYDKLIKIAKSDDVKTYLKEMSINLNKNMS